MAHYAYINSESLVVKVLTGRDEWEAVDGISNWEAYYSEFSGMKVCRTSYNTRGGVHYDPETGEPSADQTKALRFNYAGIGFAYDEARDAFIPPKPFESWVLNEETCLWDAPIPYPEDGNDYVWDENAGEWMRVVE